MTTTSTLNWKKPLLGCSFKLFSDKIEVGHLKDSEFSRSAFGSLNDQNLKFTAKSHFHPNTVIRDLNTDKIVGKISYSNWYFKAKIELNGQVAFWKFSNLWETKWGLFNKQGLKLAFRGHAHKGSIKLNEANDAMVLAGLYVSNYYWRLMAVLIACILPLFIFASL
jgi:hypothetical protein